MHTFSRLKGELSKSVVRSIKQGQTCARPTNLMCSATSISTAVSAVNWRPGFALERAPAAHHQGSGSQSGNPNKKVAAANREERRPTLPISFHNGISKILQLRGSREKTAAWTDTECSPDTTLKPQ